MVTEAARFPSCTVDIIRPRLLHCGGPSEASDVDAVEGRTSGVFNMNGCALCGHGAAECCREWGWHDCAWGQGSELFSNGGV